MSLLVVAAKKYPRVISGAFDTPYGMDICRIRRGMYVQNVQSSFLFALFRSQGGRGVEKMVVTVFGIL